MSTQSDPKGVFQAHVLSNQRIRQCYYRLNLQFDAAGSKLFENVLPGQFLQLDASAISLPDDSQLPEHLKESAQRQVMLRRPFSFSDVIVQRDSRGVSVKVEILYCILGPATARMMSLKSGDPISIIGPLGNGFSIPEDLSNAVLIGGGMGSPPILHLAGYLKRHYPNCNVTSFIGAKSCEDLPFTVKIGNFKGLVLEEFELIQVPSQIATDDGSAGFRGFVTDAARHWLEKNQPNPDSTIIFTFGPEPMLANCARLADDFSLPCQVSMERMMACGIGLCQSCAVEMKTDTTDQTQYHLCCKNGPVFDARKVVFHA